MGGKWKAGAPLPGWTRVRRRCLFPGHPRSAAGEEATASRLSLRDDSLAGRRGRRRASSPPPAPFKMPGRSTDVTALCSCAAHDIMRPEDRHRGRCRRKKEKTKEPSVFGDVATKYTGPPDWLDWRCCPTCSSEQEKPDDVWTRRPSGTLRAYQLCCPNVLGWRRLLCRLVRVVLMVARSPSVCSGLTSLDEESRRSRFGA